jgi:hypothetical protein
MSKIREEVWANKTNKKKIVERGKFDEPSTQILAVEP